MGVNTPSSPASTCANACVNPTKTKENRSLDFVEEPHTPASRKRPLKLAFQIGGLKNWHSPAIRLASIHVETPPFEEVFPPTPVAGNYAVQLVSARRPGVANEFAQTRAISTARLNSARSAKHRAGRSGGLTGRPI